MVKKIIVISLFLFSILQINVAQTDSTSVSEESPSMINNIEKWYEQNMNYLTITALMTIESSFIPFPSEIVIPPAAYVASKPDSKLNIFLVVLFGTIGALFGAFINYGLALWLGRPIMYKFADSKVGRLFLLSSVKIQKAEEYFNNHGKVSTFVGRLIPGIRQLISIPAGLARMNLVSFTIYTALGATIWNSILALLGYIAHGQADLINKYSHEIGYAVMLIIGVIGLFYLIKYLRKRNIK